MALLTDLNEKGTMHSPVYVDYAHRIIHLFDGRVVTENVVQERRG